MSVIARAGAQSDRVGRKMYVSDKARFPDWKSLANKRNSAIALLAAKTAAMERRYKLHQ
jgi:hypothetical protein